MNRNEYTPDPGECNVLPKHGGISRRQALRTMGVGVAAGALASGAITAAVAAPVADTFTARMAAHMEAVAVFNSSSDDTLEEPSNALCREVSAGQVAIKSTAGAILALRRVVELDCIIDDEGQCMVDAVLSFLSRGEA